MQIPLSVWITWMPSKIKAVLDIPDFLSTSNTAPSCVLSLIEQFARIVFVRCFLPHTLLPEVLLPLLNQNYAYYYSFPLKKAGQPTELSWRTFCHSFFLSCISAAQNTCISTVTIDTGTVAGSHTASPGPRNSSAALTILLPKSCPALPDRISFNR